MRRFSCRPALRPPPATALRLLAAGLCLLPAIRAGSDQEPEPPPLTPLWQSPWGYALLTLGLLALLLGYLYQRSRLQREVARTRRLEEQLAMRAAELAERNREIEELDRRLAEASVTDSLTGLKNRRFLLDEGLTPDASLAWRKRRQEMRPRDLEDRPAGERFDLLFLMVDLDHFKRINDLHGHAAGDRVLLEFSGMLRRACRDSDIVVRWGGDEFLIVGRQVDPGQAEALAERIRETRRHRFDIGGSQTVQTSCSIGFASFPFLEQAPELLTWEQVLAIADRALSLAKSAGKDVSVGLFGTAETSTENLLKRLLTDPERLQREGELEIRVFPSATTADEAESA